MATALHAQSFPPSPTSQSSRPAVLLTVVQGGSTEESRTLGPAAGSLRRRFSLDEVSGERESDPTLVLRAKQGDPRAFHMLVKRHQRRAFAIAITIVRDEEDAKEIVQEAFLRVHLGLTDFTGSSSFFTWLYRIVTNLSIDLIRKPARRVAECQESHVSNDENAIPCLSRLADAYPFDVVRRREITREIQNALDTLPPYHRRVLIMREVEGMTYEEMADAMRVSKGTIMSRLFHARQKFKAKMFDYYQAELAAPACAT